MTMEEWIRATFPVYDDFGRQVFEFKANGLTVQADMAIFLSIFGNVTAPPTAAELKDADPENNTGWHWCFDAWVQQGIIAVERVDDDDGQNQSGSEDLATIA